MGVKGFYKLALKLQANERIHGTLAQTMKATGYENYLVDAYCVEHNVLRRLLKGAHDEQA